MGEIEAERRFFEPSKGKSGRMEEKHVTCCSLRLQRPHSGTKRVPLRPRIPTFVDPLVDPFRFRTFLSNYRPTVSDCPIVNKYRDP